MNLKGSLVKLPKSGTQCYLKLSQLFDSNQLIRETWIAMAQDMEQQADSLEKLPSTFWGKLDKKEAELLGETIGSCAASLSDDIKEDRSLHGCFALTLEMEEPLILKAYVPIIRHLRTEFSDQALEFYIMVKAHVARLSRIIQPFAGDPSLLQRVASLQQRFEHEVQMPDVPSVPVKRLPARRKYSSKTKSVPRKPAERRTDKKASKPAHRSQPLGAHADQLKKRAKALVGKMEIARRRARR